LRRAWIEENPPAVAPDASPNGYMVRDGQDGTYAVLPPDFYRLLGCEAHFGDGIPWMMRPYMFTQRFKNSPRNGSFMKGMDLRYRLAGAINTFADAVSGVGVGQRGNIPTEHPHSRAPGDACRGHMGASAAALLHTGAARPYRPLAADLGVVHPATADVHSADGR